ncbi:Alpha/Beta hydrolase protein [Whalleya microplaca]|nr:Alpha/Beta hydrolase protein [Whalleya microplaca]
MLLQSALSAGLLVSSLTFAASLPSQKVLSHSNYQSFNLPEHPDHAIRIKEQTDDLCDAGSKQYTGWLDTGGKHLFFWYAESLNDPQTDPLNLWMTGGPGCSGLIGMMLELGPCLINNNGTATYRNPFSWTRNASMIFIDQPAGTGFSYVDEGYEHPHDSFVAASDMHVFLRIFYTAFPHLQSVPFHISGESYGGHYVPTVAAEIIRYNTLRIGPDFKIPLTSIMMGDGFVSPLDSLYGYYDTLCTTKPGVPKPVFNDTRCTQIAESLPRCAYLHQVCYEYPDTIICQAADSFCSSQISDLFYSESGAGGRDPFDITRTCEVDLFCYKAVLDIQSYMNTPSVWSALDVPKAVTNFSLLSTDINEAFSQTNDGYISTAEEVRYVLEAGVDVLVYNGNLDLACNTAGNLRWTERLPWAGQAEFVSQNLKTWYAPKNGETIAAGTMKEVSVLAAPGNKKNSRFSFVTFDQAGHMVPLDQPEVSLHLIQTWMSGEML